MAQKIEDEAELELMAPVQLNIVCFRYRCRLESLAGPGVDSINANVVMDVQEFKSSREWSRCSIYFENKR